MTQDENVTSSASSALYTLCKITTLCKKTQLLTNAINALKLKL